MADRARGAAGGKEFAFVLSLIVTTESQINQGKHLFCGLFQKEIFSASIKINKAKVLVKNIS
jgi:hypothetical protein